MLLLLLLLLSLSLSLSLSLLLSLSLSFTYFFLVKDPKRVDNKAIAMAVWAPGIQLWIN